MTISALIRQSRVQAGLTQAVLAERADVSLSAVSKLENDVGHDPGVETLGRLSEALGLDLELFEAARMEMRMHRNRQTSAVVAAKRGDSA